MRRALSLVIFALLSFGTAAQAADTFPSRPITIIVPFAAGGPTDVLARVLGERMRAALGQPVLIENVTGAGGRGLRFRLQPGQQFIERFRRHVVLADDDHRVARQQRHRLEIVNQIVTELVDRTIADMGAEMAERDRVAVGGCMHRAADAD